MYLQSFYLFTKDLVSLIIYQQEKQRAAFGNVWRFARSTKNSKNIHVHFKPSAQTLKWVNVESY